MKKALMIILLAAALLPSPCLASSMPNGTASEVSVVITKYEPYPAGPGSYVDVWFKAVVSSRDASNLTFELEPSFPFSIDSSETAVQGFGAISAGSEVVFKYKTKVDEDAVEGTNKLRLKYKTDSIWVSQLFDIDVRTVDAVISVENMFLTPGQIPPGGTAYLSMTLKNLADSLVKDVTVSLDLSSSTIPIGPTGSTAEKKVKSIAAGESEDVLIGLLALPNADAGVYKVPLTLTYYDEVGTSYERSSVISLTVGGEPGIITGVERTDIKGAGESGAVVISLVNPTPVDIKFLTVELGTSADFELISSSSVVYIGDLDSDDIDTAEFYVYVKKSAGNTVSLPVKLAYTDANNNPYVEEVSVGMRLFTADERSSMGIDGGKGLGSFVLLVIAAVLAYFGYRRWKKKGVPSLAGLSHEVWKKPGRSK